MLNPTTLRRGAGFLTAALSAAALSVAFAEEHGEGMDFAAAYEEDGKHFTADDIPTYKVGEDGAIDWYAFSGFRRYHSECHVCHGPDGLGSSYAPALTDSVMTISYDDFLGVVAGGKVGSDPNNIMPAFADNGNVMCYIDDIYVYLAARADGALERGRPRSRAPKPQTFIEEEDLCMSDYSDY